MGCKKHVQTGGKVDDEYPSDIHSATCANQARGSVLRKPDGVCIPASQRSYGRIGHRRPVQQKRPPRYLSCPFACHCSGLHICQIQAEEHRRHGQAVFFSHWPLREGKAASFEPLFLCYGSSDERVLRKTVSLMMAPHTSVRI